MDTTNIVSPVLSSSVSVSASGRMPKGGPFGLATLARIQTRERAFEKSRANIISLQKEEKARRNCFRTFLNRQEALDEKTQLYAQMGLLSYIAPELSSRLDSTFTKVEDLTSQTTQFLTDTRTAAQNIQDSANTSKEELKTSIGSFFSDLPSKIQNLIETQLTLGPLSLSIKHALIAVLFFIAIYVFNSIVSQFSTLINFVCQILSSLINIPSGLIDYFTHAMKTADLKCQINTPDSTDLLYFINKHTSKIFPIIATVLTTFILGKLPGKPATPDILLRRCRDLPGACKGLSEIHTYLSKHWDSVVSYVKEAVNGPDPLDPTKGFPDIEKWMKDVLYYSDHTVFKTAIANKESNFTIMQLWFTGMNILTTYRKALDRETVTNITLLLRTCAQMKAEAEKSGVWNSGPRMEPQMVWLTGGSGVGKSSLIYYLAAHILKPLGLANKIKEAVYLRTVEQEYWDGYRNQPLVAVDDAFQLKDGAASPNIEFMEAIRMSNMFPLNLHMADLTEKATTMFNGKCILYTTNNRSPQIESITYPEAFFRRFTHCYEVRIKKDYQLERVDASGNITITLDAAKAKADAPVNDDGTTSPINLNVYEFAAFDAWSSVGKPLPDTLPTINFDTFAKILRTDMENRVQKSDALLNDVQQYAERLHAQIGTEEFSDAVEDAKVIDLIPTLPCSESMKILYEIETENFSSTYSRPLHVSDLFNKAYTFTTNIADIVSTTLKMSVSTPYKFYTIASLCYKSFSLFTTLAHKTYNYIKDIEWTNIFTRIKDFFTSSSILLPLFLAGALALAYKLFGKYRRNSASRKWRHIKIAESFHPETQPRLATHLVTESFHPETQPRAATHLVTESFHPETQPRLATHLVTESFHPETQPRLATHLVTENANEPTEPLSQAIAPADLVAQGCLDSNQMQVISLASKQQYQIIGTYEDGTTYAYGNGIVIKGSIMLTCNHFLTYMKYQPPTKITLRNAYLTNGIVITYDDFVRRSHDVEKNSDLTLIDLSRCVPPGKDLTRHFISRTSLHRLTSFTATVSGYKSCDKIPILCAGSGKGSVSHKISYTLILKDGTTQTVYAIQTISYHIDTQQGDCGMIATVSDYQLPAKIIGLHVAGSNRTVDSNYASLTTSETLNEAIDKNFPLEAHIGQGFEVYNTIIPNLQAPIEQQLDFDGEFIPVGTINSIGESLKTRIKPSSIYGKLSTITVDGEPAWKVWNEKHPNDPRFLATNQTTLKRPARLQRFKDATGQLVDPLLKGIQKAGLQALTCNTKHLDLAANSVKGYLFYDRVGSRRPKRLLTHEEAICGISDKDGINGISRVTSPGYPWNTLPHKGKGKTHWMGFADWDFTSKGALELLQFCNEQEALIRKGQRLDIVWVDTLKDEVLPHAKVEIGKTRVFSNGPMHYTVLFRKYFMMFMAHVMDNRISNEICVGIDPNSIEWQLLANKLTSKGPKVFDGDFAQYDGTLCAKILWKVLDIINEWYDDGPTNRLARATLWADIVHSVHACRTHLYQWTHSIPSGCPITAIVNSIYNSLSMRVVFLDMCPNRTIHDFEKHVAMASYGDDNAVNVSDEIEPEFNQIKAAEGYANIGMTYTDADKESELRPYKKLSEISFLKRFWVHDPYLNFYGAPSTLSSRLDILNWTRNDNMTDPHENEMMTVTSVAYELAYIGEEAFNFWTPLIAKAYHQAGQKMPVFSHYTDYLQAKRVM